MLDGAAYGNFQKKFFLKINIFIVFGGYDSCSNRSNIVERFDPRFGKFKRLPPLNANRSGAAAVVHNERIYVAGGRNGSKYLSSVEMFAILLII